MFTASDIDNGVLRGNRPGPLAADAPFAGDDPRQAWVILPVDPRAHFALNCGARSCPAVRTYDAARVDRQLDEETRAFLAREVTLEGDGLTLPQIFEWFRADFDDCPGGLYGFIARHLDDGAVRRTLLAGGLAHVAYRPWDWGLASWTDPA